MIENVHAEVYALLIDIYLQSAVEKEQAFRAITTDPTISIKAQWALKWIEDQTNSFAVRVFAFACVEGIFFSSTFAQSDHAELKIAQALLLSSIGSKQGGCCLD